MRESQGVKPHQVIIRDCLDFRFYKPDAREMRQCGARYEAAIFTPALFLALTRAQVLIILVRLSIWLFYLSGLDLQATLSLKSFSQLSLKTLKTYFKIQQEPKILCLVAPTHQVELQEAII